MRRVAAVVALLLVGTAVSANADSQVGAGTIAFQVYGEASNPKDGVYLVSADGTALHRLRNQPANSVAPRFSPDGRHLLVVSVALDAFSSRLYVIRADGANRRLLLTGRGAGRTPGYGDWSPDGRRIVFVRGTPCTQTFICGASLYEFTLATRRIRKVTGGVLGLSPPAWSPDGRLIAFSDATGGLNVVAPDGRTRRRLTDRLSVFPAWTPDSRTIAFTTVAGPVGTYTIGVDGRNRRRLLPGDDGAVSWSPDGRRMVFVRGSDNGDLYVADGDGRGATRLTDDTRDETLPDWAQR